MSSTVPISSTTPAAPRPVSLAQAIRQGGPLAQLFHEAAGQQRQAVEQLLRGRRAERLIASLRDDAAERVEAMEPRSPLQVVHQCAPGCSACCRTVAVDVTPLEALAAADYVRENFDAPQLHSLMDRLRTNAEARSRMKPEELRRVRLTCALLNDEGQCSIYPARPLACAGAFSLSKQACDAAAASGPSSAAAQQVPLDPYTKTWTMGVSGGLQRALVEAGLDGNLYELNSIVLRCLEVPDAARRWLRGQDVFRGCICTDTHSPPRVKRRTRRAA